mgnify:CR=1 FL=1
MAQPSFTFIDLFAGIGGFKMAVKANGGECLGFSEVNKDAIETYCLNHHIDPSYNFGDIRFIKKLPKHDLLTAGVPCQSWSIAGKNLGFQDDRGQLWNDTLYLLNQSQPKAFIFENVKGLVDPRNKSALVYILQRIKEAGYHANYYVINSHDYGVAQNRIRIYIIGFREKTYFDKFQLPKPVEKRTLLSDVLNSDLSNDVAENSTQPMQFDLFSSSTSVTKTNQNMSLSNTNGYNDYFLFNDLRNGETTIHSWDIENTTAREKEICLLFLRNRRKSEFGLLDGNPLSLQQFQALDSSITKQEIDGLIEKKILKKIPYRFKLQEKSLKENVLSEEESQVYRLADNGILQLDYLKTQKVLKHQLRNLTNILQSLENKGLIRCDEQRYEFRNTKISSGINGINRIFLPSSDVFPTLVASDTNDFIALKNIVPSSSQSYRNRFLNEIYFAKQYRKINKEEACLIQGFPKDFQLPESRSRWMKLIGNSVSVPVIDALVKSIVRTNVFSI